MTSQTRLEPEAYLDHIRTETTRFLEVLTGCDPDAPVPTCPGWTAADLLWHLSGEVQHFWTWVVRNRPAAPERYEEERRPASHADLMAYAEHVHDELVTALEAADPADTAWTWSGEHTVGFTFRRQAHEALVHRVDAELAAGARSEVDARLAADGVDEVLDVFYGGRPPWGVFEALPHHVRVDATDTDTRVWVQLGLLSGTSPDGRELAGEPDICVVEDPGTEPDTVVEGTAADLDLWLWRRGDDAGVRVAGDREVYDRFRALTGQPIR